MTDAPHGASLAQTPRDISDFTGRDDEEAAVVDLVQTAAAQGRAAVVVVSGSAGIGKSALAVRVAHRLASDFRDGQLYVDLRGDQSAQQEPAEVLYALLTSMGLDRSAIPDGLSARAGLYRATLSRRRALVLLDNASSVSQLDPLLPGGSSECPVIVTSRSGLFELPGAERVELDLLPPEVSVQLLRRIVGADRVNAEDAAARELARLCGHLPLALRIAGAKLASRPHWTLRKACDRLSHEHRRLDELHIGDLAVAASFELSHRIQSPMSRRLFALYSALPPTPFYARTGSLLIGSSLVQAEEATELLVDARLVEVAGAGSTGDARFVFHDLLRLFARRMLAGIGDDEVWEALVRLTKGYVATINDGADVAWFEEHAETLLHLLGQLEDRYERLLVGALGESILPFLEVRARWSEWKTVATLVISAATAQGDQALELRGRRSLARVSRESGDWAAALEQFDACIALCEALHDRRTLADCLRGVGAINRYRGDHPRAEAAFHRSLAISEEVGYVGGQASAHRNLGLLRRDLGDLDAAEEHNRHGLALFRSSGDRRGEAASLRNLGIVLTALRRYTVAETVYREALALYRDMKDPRGEASTLRNLGDCRLAQGDHASALEDFTVALSLFGTLGDLHWQAATLRSLGNFHASRGDSEAALDSYRKALAIYRSLGDVPRQEETTRGMAAAARLARVHRQQ